MTLRPFANAFCLFDPEPARLEQLQRGLAFTGEFELKRPAPGWVVGVTELPGGPPAAAEAEAAGLVFCEGADRVFGAAKPDADAIARMALENPGKLDSLPGDFAFFAFGSGGEAAAVRSCGGTVPIYVWFDETTIALGTRLDYFVRFLPEPVALDPFVNAVWTTGWSLFPDSRTFLKGVSILEHGHYIQIRNGRRTAAGAYWDPRPGLGDVPKIDPQRPAQLRQLLIDGLRRDLDPDGGNLLTLSGGVDSSSLGALAVGTLGMPVSALSFLPVPETGRKRDEHYIDHLMDHFPIRPNWRVTLDVPKRLELLGLVRNACSQIVHPALCMLEQLQGEADVRVLFGGEFADEVTGTISLLPDWATHTTLRELLAGGRSTWPTRSVRDLARWGKRRVVNALRRTRVPFPGTLPEVVRDELRREYADWLADRRRRAGRDRRPLRQLALRTELDHFIAMNWEACSPLGIRRSLPFFNREVLELAFSCHPREQLGGGTKTLLRSALEGDVPSENLGRRDSGTTPSPLGMLRWTEPLDEQLQAVVREDWFPRPPAEVEEFDAFRLAQLSQIARNRRTAEGASSHMASGFSARIPPQPAPDSGGRL